MKYQQKEYKWNRERSQEPTLKESLARVSRWPDNGIDSDMARISRGNHAFRRLSVRK